jgi:hypothetical protein
MGEHEPPPAVLQIDVKNAICNYLACLKAGSAEKKDRSRNP